MRTYFPDPPQLAISKTILNKVQSVGYRMGEWPSLFKLRRTVD